MSDAHTVLSALEGLLPLVASCASGLLLGLLFFWGLWAAVKRIGRARNATLLLFGGLVLRFGVVLAASYLVARYAGWAHLLSAAAGLR